MHKLISDSNLVLQSTYARNVLTLMSGNLLAQLITLLAAPLLTRIYAPETFGALTLFVTVVAVLVPGIGGRYEVAVVVANARERRDLLFISLWLMLLLSLIFLLVLAVAFNLMSSLLNASLLGNWLWMTPLALLLTGVIAALRSWANAVKNYRQMSFAAVVQACSVTLLSIGIGGSRLLNDGLMFANVVALVLTCAYLAYVFRDLFSNGGWRWDRDKWKLALRYKDYPLFNAPSSILNGLMSGLPVVFLARYFPEAVVGYYALMVRVGVAPLSFIAVAVSDANAKKVAEVLQAGQDPMPHLRRVTLVLLAVAVPPSVLLVFNAPLLFSWFFGETWRQAGELLAILMPALAVQFVVSPLSLSFLAAGHLRLQTAWQVLSLLATLAVFTWAGRTGDVEQFFWAFMIKDVALYGLYYTMLVFALRHPNSRTIDG
jgi:O-antigen/teichoic acid export membrane protein